jgi:hypothetical protein
LGDNGEDTTITGNNNISMGDWADSNGTTAAAVTRLQPQ